MMESDLVFAFETNSVDETAALGRRIGDSLVGGLVLGLVGPLGAGKTQLVKGIAAGNAGDSDAGHPPGIATSESVRGTIEVTSPTFTLVNEYPGRHHLYHVDAYRLGKGTDLAPLGFDEWVQSEAVVVVEWADLVREAFAPPYLAVELAVLGETQRSFAFQAAGSLAKKCLDAIRAGVR